MRKVSQACPSCGQELVAISGEGAIQWRCDACEGCGVTIAVLRRQADEQQVNAIWQATRAAPRHGPRPCPTCGVAMAEVRVAVNGASLALDTCSACQFVWFDAHERGMLDAAKEASPARIGEGRAVDIDAIELALAERRQDDLDVEQGAAGLERVVEIVSAAFSLVDWL